MLVFLPYVKLTLDQIQLTEVKTVEIFDSNDFIPNKHPNKSNNLFSKTLGFALSFSLIGVRYKALTGCTWLIQTVLG